MTGFQRVQAALQGDWPDQRPVLLHNFLLAARQAGFSMKEYATDPEKVAKAHIQAVEEFALDGVLLDIDTAVLAAAIGVPVVQPEDEPARTVGGAIRSLEEIAELPSPQVAANPRVQVLLEAAGILKKYFGDEVYLRGNCDQAPFSLASMFRSAEVWMIDLAEGDERVFALLEYCSTACIQLVELMAEKGVHMISNGDSPAGPDLVSPAMYRRFALPFEARLAETAHRLGLPYLLHICGNTSAILEDMLTTALDGVELDYKTDPVRIHKVFGKRALFSGNLDPVNVLERGTPQQVRTKTLELLHLYRDSPRFVVNAGCAISPATPEENLRALIETARGWKD